MTTDASDLTVTKLPDGLAFWIHATPRARRASVAGVQAGALRVAVTAPPSQGQANEACASALARALGVRRADVQIDAGARGRRKRIRVTGDAERLASRLRKLAGSGRDARQTARA